MRKTTFMEAKLKTDQSKSTNFITKSERWFQGFDHFGEHFKMKIDEEKSFL